MDDKATAPETAPVKTMKRYGYTGIAEYSSQHKCWLGHIEGIDTLVLYEGETPEDLAKEAYRNLKFR